MPFHVNDTTPEREADALAYLEGTTRLSLALRVTRGDGQVFAFTDAERDTLLPEATWGDITVPETLYKSGEGVFPKNLQQSRDPRKIDTWQFQAFCGPDSYISDAEIAKGLFRQSRFEFIFFARDADFQWLRQRGKLGDKSSEAGQVTWKMNGLSRLLQQEVLEVTSPLSRADWGDPELDFFDLTGDTTDGFAARVTGPASGVDFTYPRRKFTLAATDAFPSGRFADGTVTFLTGDNAGYVGSVLEFDSDGGIFLLDEMTPFPVADGDSVRAQIRAPRTLDDWLLYFGTGMYFAGEPLVPNAESAANIVRG